MNLCCLFVFCSVPSLPHSVKVSLSLLGPGRVGGGGSPNSKVGYCGGGGVPVEDMQALAITSLPGADVAKHYEHIRELGKGTYGKVDLVAHRTQGESEGMHGCGEGTLLGAKVSIEFTRSYHNRTREPDGAIECRLNQEFNETGHHSDRVFVRSKVTIV